MSLKEDIKEAAYEDKDNAWAGLPSDFLGRLMELVRCDQCKFSLYGNYKNGLCADHSADDFCSEWEEKKL